MIAPFVDSAWLHAHRDEVIVADVRFYLDGRSVRDAYGAGHIPDAVFLDLEQWLAAPGSPDDGRHPLPSSEVFAEGLGRAGIGDGATVVAYDDAGGVIAARLVWMLRVLGHEAAVLDGGLAAWDGPLEADSPLVMPTTFTAKPWPEDHLASIDDAQDPRYLVLDARPRDRYLGGEDPADPRAGHIPGARSLPCRENLDENGLLLDDEVIEGRLAAIGIDGERPVISSCGSGVTACHTLLLMEHFGLPAGRLYPGSWSQYAHTDLPVQTEDPA